MDGTLETQLDFRLIAEHTYDWESWLAPDGHPLWINDAVERVVGRSVEDCLGMDNYPASLIDERDQTILQHILADARSGGSGNDQPLRVCRPEGAVAWVAVSWKGVMDAAGALQGVRLSIRDQTNSLMGQAQQRYHDALSQLARSGVLSAGSLDEAFRAITETAAQLLDVARVGIWLMDEGRTSIECQDSYDARQGEHHAGARVSRRSYPAYFDALDQDRVIAADFALTDPRTSELADGYLKPLDINALLDAPIVLAGRTVGVLCHEQVGPARHWIPGEVDFASSLADMASMAMEAAERTKLQNLHQRLASILEATPDFVGTTGMNGVPTYINPAGRKLVGLSQEAPLESWHVGHLYPSWAKDQRDQVSIPTALREGVWSGESEFQDRFGNTFPVSQVLIAHKDEQGRLMFISTVARDLRPLKKAQDTLQERERFLATLVANLPGVAYRRRNAPGWPMEYISDGCLELTGYTAEALMADKPYFNNLVHPEDHDRIYSEVFAALAEHRPFKVEYRLLRADGNEIWVWSKGRGIYDESGALIAREGFIGDINDRVRAQLAVEQMNVELEARVNERTAKLQEANKHLESFAYSVSHDLKAPLRGIDGYSRLLLEEYREQLPEEGQHFLDNVRSAAERMNQLIDDLLAYSRLERRELGFTKIPLASVIEHVLAEREIEIHEHNAQISVEVAAVTVLADVDALAQAVRNLVDNALKFSRQAKPARIVIRAGHEGSKTVMSVTDNGCGFDMKYHDRIFDIFQRLHRVEDYPGTGVGLAIVRKAIERMGGRVWAVSEPGAGATFFMELPA